MEVAVGGQSAAGRESAISRQQLGDLGSAGAGLDILDVDLLEHPTPAHGRPQIWQAKITNWLTDIVSGR